jgi:hypothetical protein
MPTDSPGAPAAPTPVDLCFSPRPRSPRASSTVGGTTASDQSPSGPDADIVLRQKDRTCRVVARCRLGPSDVTEGALEVGWLALARGLAAGPGEQGAFP